MKGFEIGRYSLFSFTKDDNFELRLPCLVKIMSVSLIIFVNSCINSKLKVDISLLTTTDLHWSKQSLIIFPSHEKNNCLITSEDVNKMRFLISQIPFFLISSDIL